VVSEVAATSRAGLFERFESVLLDVDTTLDGAILSKAETLRVSSRILDAH
jgi:hypothetical protein